MDESELVVVCHCKKHSQLYTIKDGNLDKPLGTDVTYVDPLVCADATWDKIATASKQYVWGYNCPVAPVIIKAELNRNSREFWDIAFLDILENSKRILKPGGQLIFGLGERVDISKVDLQKFTKIPALSNWKIKFMKATDFTFSLSKSLIDNKINLIIFTKSLSGGKKTRRKRRIIRVR